MIAYSRQVTWRMNWNEVKWQTNKQINKYEFNMLTYLLKKNHLRNK